MNEARWDGLDASWIPHEDEAGLETVEAVEMRQWMLTARVLRGASLGEVAADAGLTLTHIFDMVQRVCAHRNPDVYCTEWQRCLHAAHGYWEVTPSLALLRAHRVAFGFGDRA